MRASGDDALPPGPGRMALRVKRIGTPRAAGEGLRLGTVRHPPRGVRKTDWARRDYFDVWVPELAPSAPLVQFALATPFTDRRWATYARRYRREMREPARRRLIELLARLSRHADFSIACYCEREDRCHRSLLRGLLVEQGAKEARS